MIICSENPTPYFSSDQAEIWYRGQFEAADFKSGTKITGFGYDVFCSMAMFICYVRLVGFVPKFEKYSKAKREV